MWLEGGELQRGNGATASAVNPVHDDAHSLYTSALAEERTRMQLREKLFLSVKIVFPHFHLHFTIMDEYSLVHETSE